MALSINDILSAPDDPTELSRHLLNRGLIPQPSPLMTAVAPMTPPAPPPPSVAPMTAPSTGSVQRGPHAPDWAALAVSHAGAPVSPMRPPVSAVTAPDIQTSADPRISELVKPMTPPSLTEKQKMGLPTTSPGVPVGSAAETVGELQRLQAQHQVPENEGVLHKIGRGLAKAGNLALDVVAPNIAELIPGTELNRRATEAGLKRELGAREDRELREKHEENVSATNEEKLNNAADKIENDNRKTLNQRELGLRKQGLKPNPEDPNGSPIPLTRDDMSENEKAVLDLKGAQADAQTARALLDQIKANPDSPQNQAARERLKVMAQNAGTAAKKLGLDEKKFLADYFGTDEHGAPLPGAQVTPEGKPIGPRMTNAGKGDRQRIEKDYIKPAEDVEKSYQMMNNAYNDYKTARAQGKELPTGAESMLALSTHLATTFGNVKGSRVTKDMIEHHLGARSIPDSALVAVQRLTNGDVLSPDQWEAFHKLIGESRKLSWQTAVKESKRGQQPIDFLPQDLESDLNTKAAPAATTGGFADWQKNRKPTPTTP